MNIPAAEPSWPQTRQAALTLAGYGCSHFIVDGICAAVVLKASLAAGTASTAWGLIFTYNMLAFGSQAFLGIGIDRRRVPQLAAVLGCLITGLSSMIGTIPVIAICMAGIGNALFHAGGGAISLNVRPGRSAAPGLFVAPGAVGLALGTWAGKGMPELVGWPLLMLSAAACVAMFVQRSPVIAYERREPVAVKVGNGELVIALLCFSVAIRSLFGLTLTMPWKADLTFLMILTAAAFAGKALGGIMADRFGWFRMTTAAMLLATPLLSFGGRSAGCAVLGMFFFQTAMPVTLTAIAGMFPGSPSFSFGLASLALIIGAIPIFTGFESLPQNPWVALILLLASTGAVAGGLRLLSSRIARAV